MKDEKGNQNQGGGKEIKIDRPKLPDLGNIGETRNNDHFNKGNAINESRNGEGYISKPTISQANPPQEDKK